LQISKLNESFSWLPNVLSKYFDFFSGSNLTNKKRSSLIIDSFNHFKRLADYGDIDSMILIGLLLLFGVGLKFDVKLAHGYFQIAAERKSSIGFIFSSLFLISKVEDDNSIEEIYQNLENSALFDI
jgi:TPR repeat protein